MKIAAAVLAGGQSRRMGRDKAEIPSLGNSEKTLLHQTVILTQTVFSPVYVVGRLQPENWDDEAEQSDRTLFLPDLAPGLGPAGGLATVLNHLASEGVSEEAAAVALLACDLPLLTAASLLWLRTAADQGMGRHGLVVRNAEQTETLFAVYTRDCLPLVTNQLAKGRRSLQKLIEAGDFCVVEAPPDVAQTLMNVNTADDLAQAQPLAAVFRENGGISPPPSTRKP